MGILDGINEMADNSKKKKKKTNSMIPDMGFKL